VTAGVRVRVPGSTANLGSGFDALGMALGIYDTVELRHADGLRIEVTGEGADEVSRSESHLVVRVLRASAAKLGVELNGLDLFCHNGIPHSRGLGSSAAAIVAGVACAYALAGRELDEQALQWAAEFEGHADNVAASLLGGVVLAWSEGTRFRAVTVAAHEAVRPVALVPEVRSSTAATRGLLPESVPHADAAFAAGRSALALHALTRDPRLLPSATEDRLHQNYRRSAWPRSMEMIGTLRELGIAACISGAGPTVLALPPDGLPAGLDVAGFRVLELPVDARGVSVETVE
jgi:homoserine kinase